MSRAFFEIWKVKMEEKMVTSKHPKMIESVPLYAPGQISRNEKYIQTSIAN